MRTSPKPSRSTTKLPVGGATVWALSRASITAERRYTLGDLVADPIEDVLGAIADVAADAKEGRAATLVTPVCKRPKRDGEVVAQIGRRHQRE